MCVSQINLDIKQDWSLLINRYHQTLNHIKEFNEIETLRGVSDRFYFGYFGAYISLNSETVTPDAAGSITGKMVTSLIPWANELLNDLKDMPPDAISFQHNFEGLKRHIDGKETENMPHQCKLNYIIDDYNYVSYAECGDKILEYPSKKNTAWLLNTAVPHWVNGSGVRYLFQLAYQRPWQEVSDWFQGKTFRYGY